MKTQEEIQAMIEDLESYTPMGLEQTIGINASIGILKWVLGEDVE